MTIKFTLLIASILLCCNNTFAQTSYTINTIAGIGTPGYFGDGGQANLAQFDNPYSTCVDTLGNVYIADAGNNRIRKISNSGIISTIAGIGTPGFSGDGGSATSAQLNGPYNICIDRYGNLYIIDGQVRIRKVTPSGTISTIAGTGISGFSGDGGLATTAEFNGANGIAVDTSGNIYVTDYNNNRIRKINPAGIITTIAGNGTSGYTGDGGSATSAEISWVAGIAVDLSGNVFITDNLNNVVRKITTNGVISTIAGNGTLGFSGDNGPAIAAQLDSPYALSIDKFNNLFIGGQSNYIRLVDTNGIIRTIAGNGNTGFSGDGGNSLNASLESSLGISVDKNGNVFFCDLHYNAFSGSTNRIRKLTPNIITQISEIFNINDSLSVFPNPSNGNFTIQTSKMEKQAVQLFDLNGKLILSQILSDKIAIDVSTLNDGVYTLTIKNFNSITTKKIVIVH